MTVTLCVQLWAVPGNEALLVEYEDLVLDRLPLHKGRMLNRLRARQAGDGPYEVHVLQFRDDAALDEYMADPVRAAHADMRERAIARTHVQRVDTV